MLQNKYGKSLKNHINKFLRPFILKGVWGIDL